MKEIYMTDKMLFTLSIFLTGLGAGIALVACIAPRSRAARRLEACKPDQRKAAA
jgi:hypothetical protein